MADRGRRGYRITARPLRKWGVTNQGPIRVVSGGYYFPRQYQAPAMGIQGLADDPRIGFTIAGIGVLLLWMGRKRA